MRKIFIFIGSFILLFMPVGVLMICAWIDKRICKAENSGGGGIKEPVRINENVICIINRGGHREVVGNGGLMKWFQKKKKLA